MKIEFKDLYKSFKKNEVLKGINLDVKGRGITAVLGPNGSGKTTLMKSLTGLVIPDKGDILLDSRPVKGQWDYRKQINYLPQIARFPENLKVKELIRMVKDIRGQQANEAELIRLFELGPFVNKSLRNLSGGTRQKVNIVLTFMFDNPVLLLDEPSVGLDPVAMIRLKSLIRKERDKGKTILMTSHIMSLVEELADEIIFLLEGNIYFKGSKADLMALHEEDDLERAIAKILMKNEGKHDKIKELFKSPTLHKVEKETKLITL